LFLSQLLHDYNLLNLENYLDKSILSELQT